MISVVIPAYHEEKTIAACLKSLRTQDYQGQFEVIVVVADFNDPTAKIARKSGAKIIKQNSLGIADARQKGFQEAKGEILVALDADNKVDPSWLAKIESEFHHNPRLVMLYGRITPLEDNLVDRILLFFYNLANFANYLFFGHTLLTGANQAMRRSAFAKAGGFAPLALPDTHCDIFDQKFLFGRLRKLGKIKFAPGVSIKFSMRRFHQFGYFATFLKGLQIYLAIHRVSRFLFPNFGHSRGKLRNGWEIVVEQLIFTSVLFSLVVGMIVILTFFWPVILGIAAFRGKQS